MRMSLFTSSDDQEFIEPVRLVNWIYVRLYYHSRADHLAVTAEEGRTIHLYQNQRPSKGRKASPTRT